VSHIDARRSKLRPGAAQEYRRFHASIPESLAASLRYAGVLTWEIWIDGHTLFHRVETVAGYDAMVRRAAELEPAHEDWQHVIDALLSSAPGDDVMLPLVWTMDHEGQGTR